MFADALLDTVSLTPETALPPVSIAAETVADVAAREALLDRAMGPTRRRKSSEALRRGRLPAEGLAFAAKNAAGALVGTVRLWNVAAGDRGAPALLLGPLAVAPGFEGLGIGSRLVRHSIAEAARLGHAATLLVGDPEYYGGFGFSATPAAGLAMPGPFEQRRLLGLDLIPGALAGARGLIQPAGRLSPDEQPSPERYSA